MTWLDQLSSEVFNLTFLEAIAAITALVYVILASKQKIACWIFGIISSAIYVYLNFIADYFLETGLMVYYVAMGVYGWYAWSENANDKQKQAPIRTFSSKHWMIFLASGIALTILAGFSFGKIGNDLPYLDAFTTVFSILTTYLVAKKYIENWLLWVVIDFAAIFLYASKGYYLTAVLYGLYIPIAIYGYYAWQQQLVKQNGQAD